MSTTPPQSLRGFLARLTVISPDSAGDKKTRNFAQTGIVLPPQRHCISNKTLPTKPRIVESQISLQFWVERLIKASIVPLPSGTSYKHSVTKAQFWNSVANSEFGSKLRIWKQIYFMPFSVLQDMQVCEIKEQLETYSRSPLL